MSIPTRADHLRIDGELTADVGGLSTRLEATGRVVTWHVADPAVAFGALPAGDRRALGRVADTLALLGLALEVRDERGLLLRAGTGSRSWLGRLVTSSQAVRFERPFTWVGLRRAATG